MMCLPGEHAPDCRAQLDVCFCSHRAQVWASPHAPDFAHGSVRPDPTGGRDPDQGNVLLLDPQLPKGWSPKSQEDHLKQPFGLVQGRCVLCLMCVPVPLRSPSLASFP